MSDLTHNELAVLANALCAAWEEMSETDEDFPTLEGLWEKFNNAKRVVVQ